MDKLTVEQIAAWIAENSTYELNEVLIEEHDMMIDSWHGDDVRSIGEGLTDRQVKSVLEDLSNVGSDIGINWDTIDYFVDAAISNAG